MKYWWKYYKSKTPKNSKGLYEALNDDEYIGMVLLTEREAQVFNNLLTTFSDTYIYRIRQCWEAD